MTTIRLSLKDFPASYRQLGPRLNEAALRGAMRGAHHAVATLQRATSAAGPANPQGVGTGGAVNTGHYKRAWKAERLSDGARVYNVAPYASVIEHGRRAGTKMPPKEVITRWIQRRLGKPLKEARAMAFVVQRAIAKRGLVGRKVMTNAQFDIMQDFYQDLVAELDREMARQGFTL
jgi:hypothetical protein